MAAIGYVGVTDWEWFKQLRSIALGGGLDEVNFWIPSGRAFGAIEPGERFLFKLHKKAGGGQHMVAGGAVFVRQLRLPVSLAWDCFELANGVASLEEMRTRIALYTRTTIQGEPTITCVMLAEPVLLDEADWFEIEGWHDNIVSGRTLSDASASDVAVAARFDALSVATPLVHEGPTRYREALGKARLGQGMFRALVTDAYGFRCAVTGAKATPTLQAAHIVPYTLGGEHKISNGLLLRSDVHALFDRGYVTVTPDLEFRASERLRDEFDNGAEYYAFQGRPIVLPADPSEHPDRDALAWHGEHHGFAA